MTAILRATRRIHQPGVLNSYDETLTVAYELEIENVIRHTRNRGLAAAFAIGLEEALRRGADIVVNTDGDGQYRGIDIPRLIGPILAQQADIVIGDRQTWRNPQFPLAKRILHQIGGRMVGWLAGQPVPDPVSGFRAMSREACLKLNTTSSFSYTIEMVLQAAHKGLAIAFVPVTTNPVTRPSRLFKNIPQFVARSAATMLRVHAMYRPLSVLAPLGVALAVGGVAAIARYLYGLAAFGGASELPWLLSGLAFLVCSCIVFGFGVLANVMAYNGRLLEMTLERVRRLELQETAERPESRIPTNAVDDDIAETRYDDGPTPIGPARGKHLAQAGCAHDGNGETK